MKDRPHDPLPTLDTPRLRLRRIVEDDRDAVFRLFSDGTLLEHWSSPPMTDPAEASALIADIEAHSRRGDLLQWGIVRPEDDRVIGTCTLAAIDRDNGRAEIGFILGRDHHGRGYAREAVLGVLAHAFDTLGLRRIEADVDPDNGPSLRLLEALGFRREGYLRERWCVAGRVADTVLLGLLARERPGAAGGTGSRS